MIPPGLAHQPDRRHALRLARQRALKRIHYLELAAH
jgi:hypothetical protein